ncbi:hypothetical protein V8D89_010993 [Ganoderma adspersum]
MTPRLNFDVLREICGFLIAVQDVLSFSLTCSTIRIIAIERRLSMRPITISGAQSLRDLHNFVLVNKERRGPHIRAIDVPMNISREDLSKDLVDQFLAVLASATRLRSLTLYVPGQPWSLFTGHPDILPAVAQLTSLRELNVAASIEEVAVLLEYTRSSLNAFRYQPTYESHASSESLTIKMAPQLSSALQEIEVPSDFVVVASRSHVSFPAVRAVTLTDAEDCDGVFRWQMDALVRLFPSLDRTLIIDSDDFGGLSASRTANREAQKTQASSWAALDRVASANPKLLYALALACPVRHLTLDLDSMHTGEDDPVFWLSADHLSTILQDCAPTHLALIHDGLSGRFSTPYTALFPADAVASITHLVLETGYMSILRRHPRRGAHRDAVVEVETVADTDVSESPLVSGLKSAALRRVTHLRIIVATSTTVTFDPNPRWSDCLYDGVRYYEFDRIVAALPSVLPSLAYIFVTAGGSIVQAALNAYKPEGSKERERWETTRSRAWRVRRRPSDDIDTRAGDGVGGGMMYDLEELSEKEAEAIIDREDLQPTERRYWGVEDESPAAELDDSATMD